VGTTKKAIGSTEDKNTETDSKEKGQLKS